MIALFIIMGVKMEEEIEWHLIIHDPCGLDIDLCQCKNASIKRSDYSEDEYTEVPKGEDEKKG